MLTVVLIPRIPVLVGEACSRVQMCTLQLASPASLLNSPVWGFLHILNVLHPASLPAGDGEKMRQMALKGPITAAAVIHYRQSSLADLSSLAVNWGS